MITCAGSLPSDLRSRTPHAVIASSTASLGTESTNIPRVTWTGFSNTAAATTADHTSHSSHTRHATPMSSTNSKINFCYVALLRHARREESYR